MSMHTIGKELVYGLTAEGRYAYIDDVENGLLCNCTCPACGSKLIARNEGKKNKHHFAHYSKAECDYICQTNIHCMAQEILQDDEYIILPPDYEDCGNWRCLYDGNAYRCHIDHIESEKRISNIIPDIVITSGNATIFVEIYVTHAVDETKRKKIETLGNCFAVEIDLSDLAYKDLSKEQLRDYLFDSKRARWIFNPVTTLLHKNLETSLTKQSLEKEKALVTCPQGRLHKRRLSSCEECSMYFGQDTDCIKCLYNCVFSNSKITLPRLVPLKKTMKRVLQPGDQRPLSMFGGIPLR